jgi:hypothetical protein
MMKRSKFKNSGSDIKYYKLDDTRAHIETYDVKSSIALQEASSQVTSQSSGSPFGHTNLPQLSQNSGIPSAHK